MSLGPVWFLGIDALFDAIFVFITAMISWVGFRAWKFFGEDRYRLFGTGFLLLSISYSILAISNFFVFIKAGPRVAMLARLFAEQEIFSFGLLLYAIFFLLGLLFLLFLYLEISDRRTRLLLAILVLFTVSIGGHISHLFHILLAILFLFIIFELFRRQPCPRSVPGVLVLVGFLFVFIGEVLLGAIFLGPQLYVLSHLVTLAGFFSILASRMTVRA